MNRVLSAREGRGEQEQHVRETVQFVTLRPVAFAISKFVGTMDPRDAPAFVWAGPDGREHLNVGGLSPEHINDRIVLQTVRAA
jgi:hypothetical protein